MLLNYWRLSLIVSVLALSFIMVSCPKTSSVTPKTDEVTLAEVKENYALIAKANYTEALNDAKALKTAIINFTNDATSANFEVAKTAWKTSRESYGQSEAFRFAGGPIDTGDEAPEGQLNAWPLDENHLDYVSGTAGANLINDSGFTLTKAAIIAKNEEGGDEKKISTGYHAIEFLLWGQDMSPGAGAGTRAHTDYTTLSNSDRRKTYLAIVTDILVEDLQGLVTKWGPSGSARTSFIALLDDQALENILTSIGKMSKGELGSERIGAALISQDREDEHSCFSDNTHRDVYLNARGILNVYLGEYTQANGTKTGEQSKGLYNYLKTRDATKAEALKSFLETSVSKAMEASDITENGGEPFDQMIKAASANRSKLEAIKSALTSAGDKVVEIGQALLNKLLSTSV